MIEHLDRAVAALQRTAYEQALRELLEAWRLCRHDRIATTIDAVSARISRPRPGGKSIEEKQKAWHALADAGDPADLGALLATLTDVRKSEPLRHRIAHLGRLPADPRIAVALVKMLETLPIPGGTGVRPAQIALELIVELRDRRQLAELARVAALTTPEGAARAFVTEAVPRFAKVLSAAKATLDSAAIVLLDELDACLAETKPADRRGGEELFAAVYAAPDDDAPRAILADYLQECGDPRGEFIALQLARARGAPRSKREAELLRDSGRDWLGPLEPLILKKHLTFERGFLASCAIKSNAQLEDRPEWATVVDVDVTAINTAQDLVRRMPSLRAMRGIWWIPLDRPRLETLELLGASMSDIAQLTTENFPALRRLAIASCGCPIDQLEALRSLPLDSFSVRFAWSIEGDRTPLFDLPFADIEVAHQHNPWTARLVGSAMTIKHGWADPPSSDHFDVLAPYLERLPARVKTVAVLCDVPLPPNVVEALARFQ